MSFRTTSNPALSSETLHTPNTERRNKILELLRQKGEITVKDAAGAVAGLSEKTLQRELISMTAEGLLKKTGERRWSRYFLA